MVRRLLSSAVEISEAERIARGLQGCASQPKTKSGQPDVAARRSLSLPGSAMVEARDRRRERVRERFGDLPAFERTVSAFRPGRPMPCSFAVR